MYSVSSSNHLWHRAAASAPLGLSQETMLIIIVSVSLAGIVVLYSLYRAMLSCIASSNAAPLPPVQPLAHHRSQRARLQSDMRVDSNYPSSFLSAPSSTFPTPSSSHGSKVSLLDSEVGEEQLGANFPCKESQHSFPSPVSSSSIQSVQQKLSASPSRARSVSSFGTAASRRTRRSTIYGTPHSPFSHVQIVLPAPLATGLRQSMSPDRYGYPEPPPMRRARTLSYVDRWVTAPVAHEPDFSDISVHLPALPRQSAT